MKGDTIDLVLRAALGALGIVAFVIIALFGGN